MKRSSLFWIALLSLSLISTPVLLGQEPTPDSALKPTGATETPTPEAAETADVSGGLEKAESEVRQAIASYVTAFNTREIEMLLGHWTDDGVYLDRTTGQRVQGRDAMRAQFGELFAGDGAPTLAVQTESIEFLSPRVALESGFAIVTDQAGSSESEYTVVFVKDGEQWLIDRVSEEARIVPPAHYERLSVLEWLIGDWVDEGEDFRLNIQCDWTANQNFISRRFEVTSADGTESSGLQIIGWDAKEEQIRSWMFDSNGVVVLGNWSQSDGQWTVQSVATLEDGTLGSYVTKMTPIDGNTYRWEKVQQIVDGKLLPNVGEVIVQRQ